MTEAESVSLSLWTADLEPGEPREDVQRAPPFQGAYDASTPNGSIVKPGDRLGSFEVLSLIGAGGMGEVYEARDLRLGRRVAIKVLTERLSSDVKASSAFEREARAVAALSHPNILAIHEFNHEGDVAFAVTELLEGETLRQMLASRRLSWRKASEIARSRSTGRC